jgi:hypothetical protein
MENHVYENKRLMKINPKNAMWLQALELKSFVFNKPRFGAIYFKIFSHVPIIQVKTAFVGL